MNKKFERGNSFVWRRFGMCLAKKWQKDLQDGIHFRYNEPIYGKGKASAA